MIKAIAIGTSAGGIDALDYLLPQIPANSNIPIFVVQHIKANSESYFIEMLNSKCKVKEACHTEPIKLGTVYFAPPDYHLMIENDYTLVLNYDEKVNFSRPSIDVLFETAAEVYQNYLLGILLTGANADGSIGLQRVQQKGGLTIIQNPETAAVPEMPRSALKLIKPNKILNLQEIAVLLCNINNNWE